LIPSFKASARFCSVFATSSTGNQERLPGECATTRTCAGSQLSFATADFGAERHSIPYFTPASDPTSSSLAWPDCGKTLASAPCSPTHSRPRLARNPRRRLKMSRWRRTWNCGLTGLLWTFGKTIIVSYAVPPMVHGQPCNRGARSSQLTLPDTIQRSIAIDPDAVRGSGRKHT
jgi:hypothetical protein